MKKTKKPKFQRNKSGRQNIGGGPAGFRPALGTNLGLTADELKILRKLDSPVKVQDFLDGLDLNFERHGDTLMSPAAVLRQKQAHCMEGALLAALAFWLHGGQPLLLDLRAEQQDLDHVVALFRQNGYWGAVSKTNHAVLRYREPVYKTVRELALSYFHEYFLHDGRKTLREYSAPFDLRLLTAGKNSRWPSSRKNIWFIADKLDDSRHFPVAPKSAIKNLRRADPIEIAAGRLVVQKKPGKKA